MKIKSPRIIFAGENDWAQCAHRVAAALNTHYDEIVARVIVAYPHAFGYGHDVCVNEIGFFPALKVAREHIATDRPAWIFSTGDGSNTGNRSFTSWFRSHLPPSVHYGTFHIGSAYRLHSSRFEDLDTRTDAEVRFISADSMRLVSDSLRSRSYPYHYVNTLAERPVVEREPNHRPVVVHSPSNPGMKGTQDIVALMDEMAGSLDFEFRLITGVSYDECVRRRAGADIFIGQLNTEVGGHGYSSVEAAAQGMVPIASLNLTDPSVWTSAGLPVPPVRNATSVAELKSVIEQLVKNPAELQQARETAVAWAHEGAASMAEAGKHYAEVIARYTGRTQPYDQDQNQATA